MDRAAESSNIVAAMEGATASVVEGAVAECSKDAAARAVRHLISDYARQIASEKSVRLKIAWSRIGSKEDQALASAIGSGSPVRGDLEARTENALSPTARWSSEMPTPGQKYLSQYDLKCPVAKRQFSPALSQRVTAGCPRADTSVGRAQGEVSHHAQPTTQNDRS